MKCKACGYEETTGDLGFIEVETGSDFVTATRPQQDGGYFDESAGIMACPKCGTLILCSSLVQGNR